MLAKSYPYYLANKAVYANEDLKVLDKYSCGEILFAEDDGILSEKYKL